MMMIDQEKIYLGTIDNPEKAAILYDMAIIQSKGLDSKVNFNYNKMQLLSILFEPSVVEIKRNYDNSQNNHQSQHQSSGDNQAQDIEPI
jgi:hypothetical protein